MKRISIPIVRLALVAGGLTTSLSASPAFSAISVFTTRSSWEAAVGSFLLQDFEAFNGAQTEGAGVDVGDFTVKQLGTDYGGIFSEISSQVSNIQTGVLNGGSLVAGSVAVGGATDAGGTEILFTFDTPINAWGADLGGFSNGNRQTAIAVNVLGASYNIAFGQGFFGMIADSSFNDVNVSYVSGASDGVGLDNVSYTYPVPGPLPVFGAAAAFGFSRKLRKRLKDNKATFLKTI